MLLLIVLSLAWYLLADRFTPYTQQARVGAFVIPVASEVAGRVIRVNVRNNQDVKAGEMLFEVDPQPYQIAVDRARADLESTRRQIGASTAGIASAQANLRAAQANELKARQDNQRLEGLYREDPGTISVRLLEVSRANREQAVSQVAAARAEVQRAREQEGGSEEDNALLRSAATALSKAELDLSNTQIRARSAGLITDLRTDVGQFAAAGSPVMTLIAIHDVWISADMTENNLGLVEARHAGFDCSGCAAGRGFRGPRAQCRLRRQRRADTAARQPAQCAEQPRLVAPGPAFSGDHRVFPRLNGHAA